MIGLAAALLLAAAPSNGDLLVSPAHGWVLPIFTPEGYRSVTLRGDSVRVRRDDRIDVEGVKIDLFSGDRTDRVTTIILAREASYFPRRNLASGPSEVRVLRTSDDTDLTGEDWTYAFSQGPKGEHEKLSIRRHVRVVLHQQLSDFLQ